MATEAEPIPWMADADGSTAAGIENLRPTRAADETPTGRLVGIELDIWHTYREMHALLTGQTQVATREAYEQRLHDLAALLSDLHRRGSQTFEDIMIAQQPRGVV